MAVASVDIQVDARSAVEQLKRVNQQSKQLEASANGASAAVTKQGRVLQTAANGMRYFTDAAGRARAENGRLLSTAEQAAAGLQKQSAAAKGAAGAMRSLGGVIASLGAGALVASMVRGAAAAEQLQLRLKLLSGEYGETARIQQFVTQSAKTFGQSQLEASQGVADVYARLRPLGVSLDQIETIYKGFNATALASGTSAEAASSAFLQLSQALGSGALQGDEFRSVAEQVPGILRLVAGEMGVTVGELKKLGSEGKITSDVLINSLAKGFDENSSKIKTLLDQSPAQRFKEFKDSTQALSNALGSELLPALIPIVKTATELLRLFGSLPGPVKTLIAAASGLTAAFVALAPAISTAISLLGGLKIATLAAAGPWVALAAGITAAAVALAGYRSEAQKVAGAAKTGTAVDVVAARNLSVQKGQEISLLQQQRKTASSQNRASIDRRLRVLRSEQSELQSAITASTAGQPAAAALPPAVTGGGAGSSAAGGGADKASNEAERAAEAAKKEAERVAEVIRARTAEAALIRSKSELQDKIVAAEAARDPMLVARLQGQQRELDLQYQYAEQLVKETNEQAKKAIIFEQQTALVANQREVQRDLNELQARADQGRFNALQKHIEQQYELNTAAQNQLKLADGISNTLGQGIGGAFDALIDGSEAFGASLKRIASGVLIDIAKQLLQIFVIEQAINALRGVLTPFSAATPLGAGGGMVGKFGTLGPNFGIPQRAQGGSVMAGQPYLVGERGPELFMPGRSGGIARAGSFGGGTNIVVNVDAGGTNVQGNQPEGQALGRAIAAAVQAELIKQRRPGGILA